MAWEAPFRRSRGQGNVRPKAGLRSTEYHQPRADRHDIRDADAIRMRSNGNDSSVTQSGNKVSTGWQYSSTEFPLPVHQTQPSARQKPLIVMRGLELIYQHDHEPFHGLPSAVHVNWLGDLAVARGRVRG